MPDYSNAPEMAYDWMIVAYFFLGGLSAGTFLFSVVATHWRKELRPLGRLPAVLAPILLAVGLLILLVDLGQPLRAWRLMTSFNPAAALSWGVWFLNIFFVLSVLHAWTLAKGGEQKARKFGYLGVPFALLVAAYTGVLLTQAPGRALWHTALLPVLFLNGGLMSGAALGLIVSLRKGSSEQLVKIGKVLAWLVLIELGMLAAELIVMLNGGGESAAAARALLTGSYAAAFLGVEVVIGMIVPAALLLRSKAPAAHAFASALVLIGVLTMRYIVVVAGQVITG